MMNLNGSKTDRRAKKNISQCPNDSMMSEMAGGKGKSTNESELEEGEIGDDDDESGSKSDSIIATFQVFRNQPPNSSQTKRKCSETDLFNLHKKMKHDLSTSSCSIDEVHSNIQEYDWSKLRVLSVGDERVLALGWEEWKKFPKQDVFHLSNCNLESLCSLVEKHLYKAYDVAFLVAFHYEFITMKSISSERKDGSEHLVMDLKPNVNIYEIIKTVKKYHYKWNRQYPKTNIIWSIPSPPNFYKYNSILLKEDGCRDVDAVIDKYEQHRLSRYYYDLTRKFEKEWRYLILDIPVFPLHKVLFLKKPFYKRSFSKGSTPKFPKGYLRDGLYPTKIVALFCAYLLVEYIVEKCFFSEAKNGLPLKEAEDKLIQMDSDFESILNGGSGDRRYDRERKYHHKSNRKERYISGSKSPLKRSRHSSSYSRRSKTTDSERKYTPKLRSKETPKSHHRTCSRSKSLSSSDHSKEKDSFKDEDRHFIAVMALSSPSISSVNSSPSPVKKNGDMNSPVPEKHEVNSTKSASQEEVSFWNTLKYLREVHDIQCSIFRKKPHTHPQYKLEKAKFMKTVPSSDSYEFSNIKWNKYWKKRMELIFEENWDTKKKQLTNDLNVKGTFAPLKSGCENRGPLTTKGNSDTVSRSSAEGDVYRKQFKLETAETINSYLSDIDSKTDISESRLSNKSIKVDLNKLKLGAVKRSPRISIESSIGTRDEDEAALVIDESGVESVLPNSSKESKEEGNPPDFPDSKSESDSSIPCDSDIDIDGIMDDPDFLQGLEEIDKELQSVVMPVTKSSSDGTDSSVSSHKSDLASIFTESHTNDKVYSEDIKVEFVNVLKMLFRVSKRLGPIGLAVSALYHRASEELKNEKEIFSSLNSDSKSLLNQVEEKLNVFLNENLTEVQRAIYTELSERLKHLLNKMNVPYKKFSRVNIQNIASATLGKQVSDVVAFIKNTLLYHGYHVFTTDDVMNIYMSVKASQIDMENR